MNTLKQYTRHIISESQENSQTLAAYLAQKGKNVEATIYDTDALLHILPELSTRDDSLYASYRKLATGGTIHGFIEVGPPHPGHGNPRGPRRDSQRTHR